MALLQLKSVSLHYGRDYLLDGADLSIEPGERVALLGRNGCGKTSLMRLIAGEEGFAPVKPLFETGFRGVLCLFLLDMGLVAARRTIQSSKLTLRLTLLAIGMPLIHGTIGTFIGTWLGLDVGSAAALGVLAASSSYIAVPAAMRLALPEADPGIYLSTSLGITFPVNVLFGISIMATLARALG